MPDISNRGKLERSLARQLGLLGQIWIGRILEIIGDPPDLNNLPSDMWDELGRDLEQAIRPFLTNLYLDAAEQLIGISPGGVEWGLINEQAASWAKDYTYGLVSNINDTTRRALQKKIPQFFEEQLTMQELRDSLQSLFGPVRADMIASTEVTRAAVEGERALIKELERAGIGMVPYWETNNDDLVCPICGPRHRAEITDGQYPPIHVRCRCWVNWRVRRD